MSVARTKATGVRPRKAAPRAGRPAAASALPPAEPGQSRTESPLSRPLETGPPPNAPSGAPPVAERIAPCDPAVAFAPVAARPFAQLLDWRAGSGWAYVLAEPSQTVTIRRGDLAPGRAPHAFAHLAQRIADWAASNGWTGPAPARPAPACPVPFIGGAAGMFAYDLAHDLERIPETRAADLDAPVLAVGLYDAVLAIPSDGGSAWLISPWDSAAARAGRDRLRALASRAAPLPAPAATPCPAPVSNFTRPAYEAAVARVVGMIHAGDIFQANIAQRFETALPEGVTPFDIYRRLAGSAPAPFAQIAALPGMTVVSSSPERFLRCDARGHVTAEPIKGTRPRGATPQADRALARELAASAKDRAENVMIVDLLRNDLSRVCADHSVDVEALCALRSFSNVHHLVSTVCGRLRPGTGPLDLLAAAFPGGSITGAPKPQAMTVIAGTEPDPRGPYCGALGWIGLDGAMDTSIAIRTLTIEGGRVRFHAGGGIVAGSEPAAEYEETLTKASAMRRALCGNAGGGGNAA